MIGQRQTWILATALFALLLSVEAGAVMSDVKLQVTDGTRALKIETLTLNTGTTQRTITNEEDDDDGVPLGLLEEGQRVDYTAVDDQGRQWSGSFTVPRGGGPVTDTAKLVLPGNLYGTVTDTEGQPLPGVTVTVSRPGSAPKVEITNAQGRFSFRGLGAGTYELKSELEGFSTVEYPDVRIDAERNTTKEVQLSPAVEETITVTSESPLLDERKIAAGTTVTSAELEKIPTARDPWSVLQTVPGVQTDRINVGGNESGQQSNYTGPGSQGGDATWAVDGVVITDMAAVGASPSYYNFDAFEEMQLGTGGADPTLASGVQINLVTKRGTNEFRGSGRYLVTDQDWRGFSVSIDDVPKTGSTAVDVTMGVEIGGPIIKDKLWILRNYGSLDTVNLFGPGGELDNTELENYAAKLTAQLAANNEVLFSLAGDQIKAGRNAQATRPQPTTWNQSGPTDIYKLEDTQVFSSDFYLAGMASFVGGGFQLFSGNAADVRTDGSVWQDFNIPVSGRGDEWRLDGSYFFNTGTSGSEFKFGAGFPGTGSAFRYNPLPGLVDGFNIFPINNNTGLVIGPGLGRVGFADEPPAPVFTAVQFPTDQTLERLGPVFGEGHGAKLAHGLQFRMPDYAWAYPGAWQTTLALGPRQTTISASAPTWVRGRAAIMADDALFARETSLSAAALHDLLWQAAMSKPEAGCRPVFRDAARHVSQKWMLIHGELSPGHPRWFVLHLGGARPNWAELDARGRVTLYGRGLRYDAANRMLWLTGGTTKLNQQPVYTVDLETLGLSWLSPRDARRALHAKSNPARLCDGRVVRAPPPATPRQTAGKATPARLKACPELKRSVPAAVVKLALSGDNHVPGWGQSCHPGSPPSAANAERARLSLRDPARAYHPLYNPLTATCGCQASS